MDWIGIVLIGLAAGLVARLLSPGSGARGFVLTAALGVGGSLAATWLGRSAGLYSAGQSAGFTGAVIGACVVLVGHRLLADD